MAEVSLFEIVEVMLPLSVASFGGGATIIAGLEQIAVRQLEWISAAEFVHLFAVSRAAPGPGTTIATLIGWQVAGGWGAAVASAAVYLPTSLIAYVVFRLTNTHRNQRWHIIMRQALVPLGTGLVIAAIWSLFRAAHAGMIGIGLAVASFAVLQMVPKMPALGVLLGGAVFMIGLELIQGR